MKKRVTRALGSTATILGSALLTVIVCGVLLFALNHMGIKAFTLDSKLLFFLHPIKTYLGHSVFFFLPVLAGYFICFIRLKRSLANYRSDQTQIEKIRFYNGAMEILITLFFAIGVIFTAWGLQNALVSALGDLGRTEAGRLGAWGILNRLVDNGILISLWTTIVGGTGGYLMRMGKYFFLAKHLNRYTEWRQDCSESIMAGGLESIRQHVAGIERSIRVHEETLLPPHTRPKAQRG